MSRPRKPPKLLPNPAQQGPQAQEVLAELIERQKGRFSLESVCFDKQVAFIEDPAKLKTCVTGRRAGKTYCCSAYLLHTALNRPKSTSLYITLTRSNAKKIIWPTLMEINYEYKLGGTANESDLSINFPNGSRIFLSGASDSAEVEKFRGLGLALCVIDETQSFKAHLETLIEEVISKALYDYDGTLALIGTPSPVPVGYFYDCSISAVFSHHHWTMFDNPFIKKKSGKTPEQILKQDLDRKGVAITDPSIQREVFAQWSVDANSLVFKYNKAINDFDSLPPLTDYVIGIDVGYDDADALCVLGWDDKAEPSIYLVEEHVAAHQDITTLADQASALIKKYDPLKVVMDTGGLGKKIAEELRKRYALPIEAAEKSRKFEFIELVNDALRTGRLKASSKSQFAQDCFHVEWDRKNPQKLAIKDSFHSDITDAVLYSYRESLHWLAAPVKPAPKENTPEWYRKIEEDLENEALERLEGGKSEEETPPWGNGIKPTDWE